MKMARTQMTDKEKGMVLALVSMMSAEQVAHKIGRDLTTVRRFLAKYKRTKKITNLPRSGRPPALKKQEKTTILKKVLKERCKPLCSIVKDLNLQCSVQTAARTLHSFGLHSRVAAVKPFLLEDNISGRINWCTQNQDKDVYYWRHVIFSDEMSIEVGKQSCQIRVWHSVDERFKHECLVPSFKSGRVSVMVWSCFIDNIKGLLIFFDDYKAPKQKINKNIYTKVLDNNLVLFIAAAHLLIGRNPIFQHDNAPVHKVLDWLKSKNIKYMDWPSRSPDLNPIENI